MGGGGCFAKSVECPLPGQAHSVEHLACADPGSVQLLQSTHTRLVAAVSELARQLVMRATLSVSGVSAGGLMTVKVVVVGSQTTFGKAATREAV